MSIYRRLAWVVGVVLTALALHGLSPTLMPVWAQFVGWGSGGGGGAFDGTLATGQFLAPDGTTGGYAFSNATNSGVFRNASGWLEIRNAGSLAATITGNGVYSGNFGNSDFIGRALMFQEQNTALSSPGTNEIKVYVRDDVNVTGGAGNDCVLRARLQSGTEVTIVTLVTDGSCP